MLTDIFLGGEEHLTDIFLVGGKLRGQILTDIFVWEEGFNSNHNPTFTESSTLGTGARTVERKHVWNRVRQVRASDACISSSSISCGVGGVLPEGRSRRPPRQ